MLSMLPFFLFLPRSHTGIYYYIFTPSPVSCLSVTFCLFNIITARLAYIKTFMYADFHAEFMFVSSLVQGYLCYLSFYSWNLCVSWITSAKHHEMKRKGICIYFQCTLIHVLNKIQNCCYSLHGSSLKVLILHPWAIKGKQYHWNFKAMLKHLKKSMRSRF